MLVSSGLVLVLSSVIVHEADSKARAVRVQGVKGVEGVEGEISLQLKVFDPETRTWMEEDTNYTLVIGNKERDTGHKQRNKTKKKKKTKKKGKTENEKQIAVKTNKKGKSGGSDGWKLRHDVGKGAKGADGAEACLYLYPNQKHINTLLSTIMNRLTKMFIRLTKMLHMRRSAAGTGPGPAMNTMKRSFVKRFRVVQKRELFFEKIFLNMTNDFRQAVDRTRLRAGSAEERDPCAHQDTIRALWASLLDSSEACLSRAALSCIDEYLHTFRTATDGERDVGSESNSDGDSWGEGGEGAGAGAEERGGGVGKRAESRAARLVRRELQHVRRQQLQALCDKFQLCYRELQRPTKSKLNSKTRSSPRPSRLSHSTDQR